MSKIKCIIMDWAGTAVDYGCFAPLHAFVQMFAEYGIHVTMEQTRRPMGLPKREHIKEILKDPEISAKCKWDEELIDQMNVKFETYLFKTLHNFTEPIPNVIATMEMLRKEGLKIGSTTGYTAAMMKIVRAESAKRGYTVDNLVTPNEVPMGRPAPYMIFKNMIDLEIDSLDKVVKVGDTVADIQEAVNAGVWSIGVIEGSNEMGLTLEEFKVSDIEKIEKMKETVRKRMVNAGANYVINSISDLPACIETINLHLSK